MADVGSLVEDWGSMPNRLAIDVGRARYLAVIGQLLSMLRTRSLEQTVRSLFAGWLERRRQQYRDDARDPVGARRGHVGGAARTGTSLGRGRAVAAGQPAPSSAPRGCPDRVGAAAARPGNRTDRRVRVPLRRTSR